MVHYLTKYWMSLYVISRTTECNCRLYHKFRYVFACYLTFYCTSLCVISNYWISLYVISRTIGHYRTLFYKIIGVSLLFISQTIGCFCYRLLDIIVCYLTNSWVSLLVTSQTAGCLILFHELLKCYCGLSNELLNFCTFCSVPVCLLGSKGE